MTRVTSRMMYSPRRLVKPFQRVMQVSWARGRAAPRRGCGDRLARGYSTRFGTTCPCRSPGRDDTTRKGGNCRMRFTRRIVELSRTLETPVLLLDRASLRRAYAHFRAALPEADSYYAVKANPHPEVLRTLAAQGSGFEVSSLAELQAVRALGVPATRIMSSNPIKPVAFIQAAHAAGLDRFAVDSRAELVKLAHHAPGSRVYVRLTVDNSGSEWPLAKKYGASAADAVQLLREARAFGLRPYGLTFHVGSQCLDKESWTSALLLCHEIWRELAAEGIALEMLSLGGGFPVRHTRPVPALEEIAHEARRVVRSLFPAERVELTVEPGRALVGDAGLLVAT